MSSSSCSFLCSRSKTVGLVIGLLSRAHSWRACKNAVPWCFSCDGQCMCVLSAMHCKGVSCTLKPSWVEGSRNGKSHHHWGRKNIWSRTRNIPSLFAYSTPDLKQLFLESLFDFGAWGGLQVTLISFHLPHVFDCFTCVALHHSSNNLYPSVCLIFTPMSDHSLCRC